MRLLPASTVAAPLATILSVWAHPDDETWLAAGLMSAAAAAGQRVVCVSATAGEQGTSAPDAWPPHRLGPARRLEAAAAMEVLGVDEHHVLGLPDGALADHDAEGVAAIERLLDDVEPDTVLTFGPDGMTFHPDHIAVHRWVTGAWERRARNFRLLHATSTVEKLARFGALFDEWDMYMTDERPAGAVPEQLAVHLRLGGAELRRKIAALRAMPTQTGALLDAVDPGLFAALVAEEAFVDATPVDA
jgi:LmbE family N-acetylglucosaminyl deacetylase